MNKQNLLQYADLERQRREIESQQGELRKAIIEDLQSAGVEKADVKDTGVFTLVKRKTWKYSKEVLHLQEELAEAQQDEQRVGAATFEEKMTVAFYPKKE